MLEAWPHGFFQEIKSLMDTLGKDSITREEVEGYIKEKLKDSIRARINQRVIRITEGCKGCKDKKQLSLQEKAINKQFEEE